MLVAAIGIPVALFSLWILSGYLPTRNIDMPAYTTVASKKNYEIRQYGAFSIAETAQEAEQGSSGFNELFQYISGKNSGDSKLAMTAPVLKADENVGRKLAMTAPVIRKDGDRGGTIAFVMPPGLRHDELPQPTSPKVTLREIPARKVAVVMFSGTADEKAIKGRTEQLLRALQDDGAVVLSQPETALYNPPWTPPFMRRNEVMVEIQ